MGSFSWPQEAILTWSLSGGVEFRETGADGQRWWLTPHWKRRPVGTGKQQWIACSEKHAIYLYIILIISYSYTYVSPFAREPYVYHIYIYDPGSYVYIYVCFLLQGNFFRFPASFIFFVWKVLFVSHWSSFQEWQIVFVHHRHGGSFWEAFATGINH